MITLGEWAADLRYAAGSCRVMIEITLKAEMHRLGEIAAGYPGHERAEWPPLAQSTIDDKISGGYPVPSPLLRTGAMQSTIRGEADGFVGIVGSTDPKAVYHEFGTSKMPPRPIYAHVMMTHLPELEAAFSGLAARLLTPLASYRP